MELGHLTSHQFSDGQAPGQKLLLDLPNELVLLICEYLGEDELYSLSLVCRRLHSSALPICLVRCGLFKSSVSPEKIELFVHKALSPAQKRELLLRISLDITSVKRITGEFDTPISSFFVKGHLHQLMEKLTSMEEVILEFTNKFWSLSQVVKARALDEWIRLLFALLSTAASKCSILTLRQRGFIPNFRTIRPGGSCHKTSTISRPTITIEKIVGLVVGKPSFPRPIRRDPANRPDTGNGPTRSPNTTTLNTLIIESSALLYPPFLPWTIETLNNSTITTLSFDTVNLISDEWSDILPIITLPTLSVLSIDSCSIALADLSAFISRHPSLTTLNIGARMIDLTLSIQPSLPKRLPQLTTLSAPKNYTVQFLKSARAFPRLRCLTIVSHITFASDFAAIEQTFASVAARQLTNIALSLELHVHTSNWLDTDSDAGLGIGGANTLAQRVTSVVIKAAWYRLKQQARDRLPSWLARFCALERLTLVNQSRWPLDAQVKMTLVRCISTAYPGVKTVVVSDEPRDNRAWRTMPGRGA